MSSDERNAPRFDVDATIFLEAGVRAEASDTGKIVICKSEDVSATGMKVLLDQPLRKGRVVRACLDGHGHDPVFVVMKVVWQSRAGESYHHGMLLLDAPDSDKDAWEKIVGQITG
jgi:hypothetical protein